MKNVFKFIWIVLRSILILMAFWFISDTSVEHIQYDIKVAEFKSKGVYQSDISTSAIKYYKVSIKDNGYKENEKPGYIWHSNKMYPGVSGDFLATPNATLVNELISGIVSWGVGGHAAIVCDDYKDYQISSSSADVYEALGMDPGENPSQVSSRDYFTTQKYYNEVLALRCNITDEQINDVLSFSAGALTDPYNFSFGIHDSKNKSYCTDLVTKAYERVGVNLNKDGMFVSVYDLIVSSDCYLSYYHYFKDNVKYIYYLE